MPSVTRTIHFEKTQERYELTASPACVHLDGGGNQTETVTVRLMHYKGKESDEITGKYVTITDGANSANFTLPAEINQSGGTVISQSLDDREHGAPDSLTVIGILGANNLVIPVVHDGADGENAVTVQTSPEAILHKKATTSSQYSLAIRVWNGKTAVPASGFSAKIQSKPNGLSVYMIASATDSYINYLGISINANTEINGDITIVVTYNGNTYTKVVPFKTVVNGDPGIKGEKGASLRGPQAWSDLSVGYQFYQGKDGEEIKDVVLYNSRYFSCIKTHTKSATNYPTSAEDTANGYWKLGDKVELIATNILLSTYALVKNLGVEAIDMKDANDNIIFQAKGGNVICNSGTFKNIKVIGSIRNPFSLANDSIDTNYSDNVAMLTNDGGWLTSYSMPWDVSQSGRRLSIVNYKWGSTLASGKAVINAPSGKYFFEDGIQKSRLVVSREIIELTGYGTTTEFYGWIVLNRIDLATSQKYGHCLKALAVGTVSGGDSNNNTSITSSTFDGSELTVSRQSQGLYRVYYPAAWFADSNYCHVMLTGRGVCYKDKSPVKATLHSLGNGYFDVTISDDATRNDGSFDFIIYNGSDFDVLK